MNQKILFEIKKFEEKNKKRNRAKALPVSVLFTDRTKILDIKSTMESLPKNSAIIIREYDLDKKNREIFALEISKLARSHGLKILVGKDIALAKKIKSDGVHFSDFDKLPLQFLQKKNFQRKFIFSFSCHNFKSVLKAQKIKSDMIFISPIFPTTSHLNTKNIGTQNLAKISLKTKSSSYSGINLYALGGISSANISSVRKLGLSGFAAISLFLKNSMKITPVILSGGSGTRLWPLSRSLNPKQFLNLVDDFSLFQKTALRTKNEELFHNPIVVCNNEHRFIAAEELQKINIAPKLIILEPIGRNTAPAITVAALNAVESGNDDLILVMPSDHIIQDEEGFIRSVQSSIKAAQDGYLITFGIVPNNPETGYGYIKRSTKLEDFDNIFAVEKFIEKPKKEVAEGFVKDGGYFWNSGIFLFKASIYLEVLRQLENDIFIHCCGAYNKAIKDLDFVRLFAEDFEKCSNISVDYAVMEKASKVAVVPINVGWSDVGNWQALSEIAPKDKDGNNLIGDVVALKTKDCYINSKSNLVTTIGVKNLIIIVLKDATLIANKDNAQDVKELFETLKKHKRPECDSHTKVLRPWGSFETIDLSDRFKVKRITVKPKSSLSLQMHNHRAEHWVIVKGTAHVTCGSKEFVMTEDESTYIPVGKKHRLENKGQIPLEIIEVQTGNYLGEDDIIRFSDIYGR